MFPEPSWYAMLAGHGRLPRTHHRGVELTDAAKARHIMAYIRGENDKIARGLPQHDAYLKALNQAPARAGSVT
jgi:hypothetical protein